MTKKEFDKINWTNGMVALYKANEYPIVACDFDEHLIAIDGVTVGADVPNWVRCENIDLIVPHNAE